MHPFALRVIVRLTVFLKFFPTPFKTWNPIRSLTPFHLYTATGGEEFYWEQVRESPEGGVAVVLGGFRGLSSFRFAAKGYKVISFEPIPSFAREIRHQAELKNSDIQVVEAAASDSDGFLSLEENGESTSRAHPGMVNGEVVAAKKIDFGEWLRELNSVINILEINIEGSEYEVLTRLIQSKEITKVDRINIQFHNISDRSEGVAEDIRTSLRKTHNLLWSFEWIWEAWEKKPEQEN